MSIVFVFIHLCVCVCFVDLAVVHRGLSSVSLSPQDASQLKQMLHLTGSSTDLKEIVYKSIGAQVEFSALVLSLLLIPSLGRHASQLLPYCQSIYLEHVDHCWLSCISRLLQSLVRA